MYNNESEVEFYAEIRSHFLTTFYFLLEWNSTQGPETGEYFTRWQRQREGMHATFTPCFIHMQQLVKVGNILPAFFFLRLCCTIKCIGIPYIITFFLLTVAIKIAYLPDYQVQFD